MLITRTCMYSNISRTKEIDITEEQYQQWIDTNQPINRMFPHLSDNDREFIISGITPDEWDEAFREDDDEEYYDEDEIAF